MLKPPRLEPGDTVGICAPASAPPNPKAIDACVAATQKLGFRPVLARNSCKRWGFLAGTDRERAADLMQLFRTPKVKAIVCVRGGYGTARLLNLLDYRLIRERPKILVGYSDITSLHCALLKKTGLLSFHGPMLNSDFIETDCPSFTVESFRRVLMHPSPPGPVRQGYKRDTVQILRGGEATGRLVGGNLTLLCSTLGTPFEPAFRDRILFFEDLEEPPYRFDRMLTQLLLAGRLQQVAGIAIGVNANCEDPKAKQTNEYRQSLEDVFRERLLPLRVPVITGLPFGHVPDNATLPVGGLARLDGHAGDLELLEAVVR